MPAAPAAVPVVRTAVANTGIDPGSGVGLCVVGPDHRIDTPVC